MHPPLVLGTHNRKKGLELAELVAPWGIIVRTLADFPQATVVVEDGDSFAANARSKPCSKQGILMRGCWARIAGWWSTRWRNARHLSRAVPAPGATDATNNARLLAELGDTPLARRSGALRLSCGACQSGR